jgi:hypothetical protein
MSYPYEPIDQEDICTPIVTSYDYPNTLDNYNFCGTNPQSSTLSSNVIYNGPDLSCVNILTNDTLSVALQKINTLICEPLTNSEIVIALGYTPENLANKVSVLSSSNVLYPNNNAVIDALALKENSFSKNTAFNKNFGTVTGTVAEGSHVSNINNPHSVTKTQVGLGNVPNTDFTSAVAANTAKVGITIQQASDITTNNAKVSDTGTPAILSNGTVPSLNSGITDAEVRTLIGAGTSNLVIGTTATTAKAGNITTITTQQTSDITANNAKISFDNVSSSRLANTSGTNTGDQDLSSYAPLNSPTFTGTVSGINKTMIGLANVDNTTDLNKPISTSTQTALNSKADLIDGLVPNSQLPSTSLFIMTGLSEGGFLTINADNTKFDLSAGFGYIVNGHSNPDSPIATKVTWTAKIANTIPNLATQDTSYVAIDVNGDLYFTNSPLNSTQRRNYIRLGALIHLNNTTLAYIDNKPTVNIEVGGQVQDILQVLGFRSLSGNRISPVNGNLKIKKESGTVFKSGSNFNNLVTQPHTFILPEQNPITFRYRTQTGVEGLDITDINPAIYDVNGSFTAMPSTATLASVQQINIFQDGSVRIQPGQTVFTSLNEALLAINSNIFITEDDISENGLYLGSIAITRNATVLNNIVSAIFVPSQGTTTNGSVPNAPLGYTPEDEANKQDSLVVDGTGAKYPTVDAVNTGLALKAEIEPSQIIITTTVSITTDTLDNLGYTQKGKNVVIDNGVNAINITVNGGTDFLASYLKHGTGAITFVQGAGRTLTQVDATSVLSGVVGSTATISSVGTIDYLRISNAV